jgi:type I restriction enzyme, R subunit
LAVDVLVAVMFEGNNGNVRAQLRVIVKRILRKYGYPPDKQEKATQTVLEQAELLSQEWAVA